MFQSNKIIVIGGNAAGPAAAAKAKRVNPKAEVALFEAGEYISTGNCELPYLISGEIENYKNVIFFDPDSFNSRKGVKVYNNHLVESINTKQKNIAVTDLKNNSLNEVPYDKLILTTGSKAKEHPILNSRLENVFQLKTISDYLKIEDYFSKNNIKKVLVIGSGYIGLEIADVLKIIGKEITVLEKAELPMPSADEEVQYLLLNILQQNNVQFLHEINAQKFIINENKFTQLKYEGRFIDFDAAIISIGFEPNNILAESANLEIGKFGGLRVNNRLLTSNPHIYAAGDNIEVKNKITNKWEFIPLATFAHSYGHIAGANAAGSNLFADPIIKNTAFKLFENSIAQVGLTYIDALNSGFRPKSVSEVMPNIIKVMPSSKNVFGKIVYDRDTHQILGASFIGRQEVIGYSNLISLMISNKIKVDELSKMNFNYTPPLSPFVNLLSVLGRKINKE